MREQEARLRGAGLVAAGLAQRQDAPQRAVPDARSRRAPTTAAKAAPLAGPMQGSARPVLAARSAVPPGSARRMSAWSAM